MESTEERLKQAEELLKQSLNAFNCLPNQRLGDGDSTYNIAARIDKFFSK